MAKGQLRSNRESRKPKKEKASSAPPAVSGAQVKLASSGLSLGKKQR